MRSSAIGLVGLVGGFLAAAGLSQALEFRTHFDGNGTSGMSVIYVPAREPIAALHARLHFRAAAGLSAVTISAPEQGAWSQVQPRCTRVGDALDLWLLAPATGESRDSSEKTMAGLVLTISGGATITTAGQLIDSVEILAALGPDGRTLSPAKNLTTSLRPLAGPGATQAREVSRGNLKSLLFNLGKAQRVRAYIADAKGRAAATLFDGKLGKGLQEISWDPVRPGGKSLTPGTYFLRLQAGSFTYDRKMEVKP
jgi:hypothetical protein